MKEHISYFAFLLLSATVFAEPMKTAVHDKTGMQFSLPTDWSVAHGDDFISLANPTETTSLAAQVVTFKKKITACALLTKIERDYNDKRRNLFAAKNRRLAAQRLKFVGADDGCQGRYFFKDHVLGDRYEEYLVFTDSKKGVAYQLSSSYPAKLASAEVEQIRSVMNSFKIKP